MAGMNKEYADFRGADLQGRNFTGSNLRYSDFRGADVSDANFQYASLYEAKMQGVKAFETDFRNSDLRLANFGGAYLDKAAMPPPERLATPGEIDGGQGRPGEGMGRELNGAAGETSQDGKTGNDGNGQAGRSLPNEQWNQGKSRGPLTVSQCRNNARGHTFPSPA